MSERAHADCSENGDSKYSNDDGEDCLSSSQGRSSSVSCEVFGESDSENAFDSERGSAASDECQDTGGADTERSLLSWMC